jgi:hypothetical protein
MTYTLASGLASWGQAAAIILGIYLFVSILLGLALAGALMFGFAWVREKSELIKRLRPPLNQFNEALAAAQRGDPLPPKIADNKIVSTVAKVPSVVDGLSARASTVEEKVEQGSNRVANAVIEFRSRGEMVKGMARAFFLPGLPKKYLIPVERELAAQLEGEQIVATEESKVAREEGKEERPLEQEIVITQSTR